MCSESTSRLGREQLVRLLRIGSETDPVGSDDVLAGSDEAKAVLFDEMVRVATLANRPGIDALPNIVQRVCEDLPSSGIQVGADVLVDRTVGLETIRRIKDHAKARAKHACSSREEEVAAVLYYAAMASALILHGKTITKIPYDELSQWFGTLRSKTWIPKAVVDLMEKASEICENKMRTGQ